MSSLVLRLLSVVALIALVSCNIGTDAATRIAYDIEHNVKHLGAKDGSKFSIEHHTPSQPDQCTGPYSVQFDKVGALIIWCKDANGAIVSSHSTTYHARFVDTLQTFILEKPAGASLIIDIERRHGRALVTNVR